MNDRDTPLWQLQQNAKSKRLQASAFQHDIERYTKLRDKAIEDAEEFERCARLLEKALEEAQ